jgi:divalent metal cation (Fe/Co/Zn/Cd) transporter
LIWVEVHLLFPGQQDLESAHAAATQLESEIERELEGQPVVVTTHLEPLEQHALHHPAAQLESGN